MISSSQDQESLKVWEKVQHGDRVEFNKLYQLHIGLLFNYGHKISTNKQIIQDCIQELFVELWQNRKKIKIEYSVRSYLYTVLRRKIIKTSKSNNKIVLAETPSIFIKEKVFPKENDSDSEFQSTNRLKMKEAIKLLPRRQKEAIFLKYFENYDSEEIAIIMDIQITAVYKLISRAIQSLRQKIRPEQ